MVSHLARHILATVIVALGAAPGFALPPNESERPRTDEDRNRLLDEIGSTQTIEGSRSADLIEPLTELGLLLAAEGQHVAATAALEEARQVVRTNYGLHTLEQVALIEQAMESQREIGDLAMVQALEEELLELATRHPEDMRTVAIHREVAERRVNLLASFLAYEYPAEIYGDGGPLLPEEPERPRPASSAQVTLDLGFTRDEVITQLASEAQLHFAGGIMVILENGLYTDQELRNLELAIVRISDGFRQRTKGFDTGSIIRDYHHIVYDPQLQTRTEVLSDLAGSNGAERTETLDGVTSRYRLGRESYRRLIAYEEAVSRGAPADGQAWSNRLDAYFGIADWDLLYSQNGLAVDEYSQIHEILKSASTAGPLIDALFAPQIPVVLPTFLANPFETPVTARYIDVKFEITRFGESRRIEILRATPDVEDAEKADLVNLIGSSRFRPRVADGELARAAPVTFRYHLND
jgi:hypothetical protein